MALFHKDKKVGKGLRKMDAVITWLVLWWIVASVYGIKKHEEGKKTEEVEISKWTMSTKSILKWLVMWFKDEKLPQSGKNPAQSIEKKPGIIKIVLIWMWRLIKWLWKK